MKKSRVMAVFLGALVLSASLLAGRRGFGEICKDDPNAGRNLPDCSVDAEKKEPCAPDYTVYSVPLQRVLRVGAGAAGSPKGAKDGFAGLSAFFLVDTVRAGAEGGGEVGSSVPGIKGFAGGKATLSMRSNFSRKGECSRAWWGADVDVSGRYSSMEGTSSYFSGKTPAYIGYFTKAGDRCVLKLFARAGMAWFDDRTTAGRRRWLKPLAGGKGVFRCREGIEVVTTSAELTFDHLFSVGGPDTEAASLDFMKTWRLDTQHFGVWRLGLFGALEYDYEHASADGEARSIGLIRGGVQILR